jgi:hypothetical protein
MRPADGVQGGVRRTTRALDTTYDQASMKGTPTCVYSLTEVSKTDNQLVIRLMLGAARSVSGHRMSATTTP